MSQFASVNQEACIACGACNSAAPDIFDLDYNGIAGVIYAGDKNRGITAIEPDLHGDLQEASPVARLAASGLLLSPSPLNLLIPLSCITERV